MKMGDKAIVEVEPSLRSLGIDLALGVGGYPRGRVIEIYGPESSERLTQCYCRSSKRVELLY
jgi:recombination protein RecA